MTTTRPAPGELMYRAPECPLCGRETESDGDVLRCYSCGALWTSRMGDTGEWDDAPQCRKVLHYQRHPIFADRSVISGRCILSDDHDTSEHNNGTRTWHSGHLIDATETEETG